MKNNPLEKIRVALHARTLDIQAIGKTRELSLAHTTCQQARMLLGVVLRLTGGEDPYPQSDNPASGEITPAVNTAPAAYTPELPEDEIARVKEVRRRIGIELDELTALHRNLWARDYGSLSERVFERAYTELALAKNWLGMHLALQASEAKPKAAPTAPASALA